MEEDPVDDPELDFRKVLLVPGTFLPINNIVKRILKHSRVWALIKKPFTSLCYLFHRPDSRKAFVQERLVARGHDHLSPLFSSGPPLLEGGRVWGVINVALEW